MSSGSSLMSWSKEADFGKRKRVAVTLSPVVAQSGAYRVSVHGWTSDRRRPVVLTPRLVVCQAPACRRSVQGLCVLGLGVSSSARASPATRSRINHHTAREFFSRLVNIWRADASNPSWSGMDRAASPLEGTRKRRGGAGCVPVDRDGIARSGGFVCSGEQPAQSIPPWG
jgi:hypothetical protein